MKKLASTIIASVLILISAAACITITVDKTSIKDGYYEDYNPPSSIDLHNTFDYSEDQVAVVVEYGSPTRFTILFGQNNRLETWHYDTHGYTVAFMNGTRTSERTVPVQYHDNMYATTYTPKQFYAGMGVNEIVLATGRHDFQLSTIEAQSYEQRLMHLEGLAIGLQDDSINYVETYPALTENKLTADAFAPVVALTPEESANAGLHEYLVVINLDSDAVESYNTMIDTQFSNDKVCLLENNETYCFLRSGENQYITEDGQTRMSIILDGFIWISGNGDAITEVLFSRMDD